MARIDYLRQVGTRLAEQLDWSAILDGTATGFRVKDTRTMWQQYNQTSAETRPESFSAMGAFLHTHIPLDAEMSPEQTGSCRGIALAGQ